MAHGQEASEQAFSGAAPLCANGCGFFGSEATKYLCSKCYTHHLKVIQGAPVVEGKRIKANEVVLSPASQDSAAAATEAPKAEAPETKTAPNRCTSCNKKVGLLGFTCRCGGTFCSMHRYVDAHACDFDYKKAGREKIAEQNPLVVAPKINKI